MKNINLIILFLVFSVNLFAFENSILLANDAYQKGNYDQAIVLYESVLEHGESPELYYNLGNAYYKTNQIGKSILNYERALRLRPSYEDAKHNLALANTKVLDKIEPIEVFFLSQWIDDFKALLGSNSWAILSIVFFIATLVLLLFYVFSPQKIVRQTAFFVAIFSFLFFIIFFGFSSSRKKHFEKREAAIVMQESVTVKSSPDESGTELFILHEGSKVFVREVVGGWSEIKIADGNIGWIKNSEIERF
jgi:hypothetical protein